MLPSTDRIAAIATAPGRGGIGVVRISGRELLPLAQQLTGKTLQPRQAHYTDFLDHDGTAIDRGLAIFFPAPHSFTGEDVLELQGHGGPVVMQLLLQRCLASGANIRLAEPGEFSRRAFENGKLDLTQAEAVADLIDATTTSAARSAVRSLQGEFSAEIHRLDDQLTELRALTEASLDFPEEDIDFIEAANARGRLAGLQSRLLQVFDRAHQGKLLQGGLQVVLIGQPNVGKSSLLNQLAGDELAIVTPIAGTTRDALRGSIQINGIALHLIDTAGLRSTDDEVEQIGIARTWHEIERADAALLLVDAREGIAAADQVIVSRLPERLPCITVFNKIDLTGTSPGRQQGVHGPSIHLCAKSGAGIPLLQDALLELAGWHPCEDVFIARERHLIALRAAAGHLDEAALQLDAPLPALELLAESLRLAHQALCRITGEFTADDLLGEIFGRFCIGK